MKACMEQVKAELGSDAVILHTKKYREGGFLGYGSSEVVEVTAAIEDQEETPHRRKAEPAPAPVAAPTPQPRQVLNQYKTAGTQQAIQQMEQPAPMQVPPISPARLPQPAMPQAAAGPSAAQQPALQAQPGGNMDDKQKIDQLENELAQMKAMLAQVIGKENGTDKVTLQDALKDQDVAEDILKDFAAQSPAGETLLDRDDPQAKNVLTKFLSDNMRFAAGIHQTGKKPRTVALIGATGVGKTTTLAKIAARLVLEKGVKAALITADTYRISAVEQLKTYSDIIGLPLEIVYTPDELRVAIHKHRDKDIILIDTAGRSQHNAYQMKELQEFLAVAPDIEKHLVLSSTTKNKDAAEILKKFSVCKPGRVIFTKADETSSLGLIVNLLYHQDIALSFLTDGQSVPDDIVPATAESLAGLLLRE